MDTIKLLKYLLYFIFHLHLYRKSQKFILPDAIDNYIDKRSKFNFPTIHKNYGFLGRCILQLGAKYAAYRIVASKFSTVNKHEELNLEQCSLSVKKTLDSLDYFADCHYVVNTNIRKRYRFKLGYETGWKEIIWEDDVYNKSLY